MHDVGLRTDIKMYAARTQYRYVPVYIVYTTSEVYTAPQTMHRCIRVGSMLDLCVRFG
jgi:hypothetical protein